MEAKPRAAITERVYEELEPSTEWVEEDDWYTLLLYASGFKKQQLKVERDTNRNLIISGERQLDQDNNKWIRFKKQIRVPTNCDIEKISARFDHGMLSIKLPKLITLAAKQDQENLKASKKEKNSGTPQDQNMGEDKKMQRNTSGNYKNGSADDGTRRDRGDSGKKDYGDQATLEGAKLRKSRRMMNMVLIILLGFVLRLYLTNLISFWKKDEN